MRIRPHLLVMAMLLVASSVNAKEVLDSLKYIFPEFTQGTVIFADKQISRGMLNISPMNQCVYCLSPEKDTLAVAGTAPIVSVSVAGRTFLRWKESFVEIITKGTGTGVGITRTTTMVNNVKTGPFGMNTATSSVKSYSVNAETRSLTNLIIDDPRNYVYSRTACLLNNGKVYPVSRKSFEKVFPEKKDYIESVWPGLNLVPTDIDAVLSFYKELLEQQ